MSFASFQQGEVKPVWAVGDSAWFVLWLAPAWLILLTPLVLLCRRLKPQNRVLAELAAALDRVEADDMARRFADADVKRALGSVRRLAVALSLLAPLLLPWVPAWFLLLGALPLTRPHHASGWVVTAQERLP